MDWMEVDTALAQVAQSLQRSTVEIYGSEATTGSGMIWNTQGLIITNSHVMPHRWARVILADQREYSARLVARDQRLDLAAIVIEAGDLSPVEVSQTPLQVGELVMAVGNPLGAIRAVTVGMVHTVSPFPRWIRADIQLAPGNSGGPLATLDGRVVGLNTQIASGQALAIPMALVRRFLGSQQDQPYLGIALQPLPVLVGERGTVQWVISQVAPHSPAALGGLLSGDQIISINRQRLLTPTALVEMLDTLMPDQRLMVEVLQRGTPSLCTVRVGRRASGQVAA